ncbi:glycosyltransferase family 2 protein [Gimesia sp.]|uniref:glycosyltransferase family 2 protein n=1 Tax=Gimesia sp. TaxID=2024833 RepID=UPI003A947C12
MNSQNVESVASIIVTFNPDFEVLKRLLNAIASQVSHVFIVDNSPEISTQKEVQESVPPNGSCITMGGNFGIAEAINHGITTADKMNFSHVVFFDQDSLPSPDLINTLINAMNTEIRAGKKVAAVGPNYQDVKGSHSSPFVKLIGGRLCRIACAKDEVVSVDHLITSGCLVSMASLNEIGLMEEKLFIDYVDTEWCLRAISKGYEIIGVGNAQMQHDLGNNFVQLFGRTIPVHSSLRYYYLIRNGIWLLKQKWVSGSWKLMDARRLFLMYVVYSFFIGRRVENWKMLSLGIWHAMIGKMGKFSG